MTNAKSAEGGKPSATDRIEKERIFPAPRARVWRAISDVKEFNAWFRVALTSPFVPGATVSGKLAVPGYEHLTATLWIEEVKPEQRFSFRWHPFAIDPKVDYSNEPTTLVTFTLEEVEGGTRLTVVESGFDAIPESRRVPAFQSNDKGWAGQLEHIRKYLVEHP